MTYKVFIRYALSGLVVKTINVPNKDGLYLYVGKLVLGSIEHIERIDFTEVNA